VKVIEKLHPPMKGVRSFVGHVGFYKRFIKDFSNVEKPFNNLINKNNPFNFDENFLSAYETLKGKRISLLVIY